MIYFPILKLGSTLEAIGLGSVGCELLRIESYLGKPLSEREGKGTEETMASILFTSFAWLQLSPFKTAARNKLTPNKKIIRFSCHTWSPQQKALCWATFLDSLHWPPWSGLLHPGLPDCAAVHLWRGGFSWRFPAVFFPEVLLTWIFEDNWTVRGIWNELDTWMAFLEIQSIYHIYNLFTNRFN